MNLKPNIDNIENIDKMIRAIRFSYTIRAENFRLRESFWLSFGRFVKNHFSSHSSKDNESYYSDSESFTDTMDDLEDIFNEFEGDFDEITNFETGYDGDSEDDD